MSKKNRGKIRTDEQKEHQSKKQKGVKKKNWTKEWWCENNIIFVRFSTGSADDPKPFQFSVSRFESLLECLKNYPVYPAKDSRNQWRLWYDSEEHGNKIQIVRYFLPNSECVRHKNNDPTDNRDENIAAGSQLKNTHDTYPCARYDEAYKMWMSRIELSFKSGNKTKTHKPSIASAHTAEECQHEYARFLREFVKLSLDDRQNEDIVNELIKKFKASRQSKGKKKRTKAQLASHVKGPNAEVFRVFLEKHYPDLAALEY